MRFLFSVLFTLTIMSMSMADVRLPKVFGNNMVLQRELPLKVWGWGDPSEKVTVTIESNTATCVVGEDGKWITKLPEMNAGGPYILKIKGKNEIIYKNVLIGDVWICGGQSNMQWAINQTNFVETDTNFISHAPIRLMQVNVDMDYFPKEDINTMGWFSLDRQVIEKFSAVGYHFGKYLSENIDVPIGLISDNLGATAVETWMSNEAVMEFPQFEEEIQPVLKVGKNVDQLNQEFEKTKEKWFDKYYFKGLGVKEKWQLPDTDIVDWKPIEASGNTWENEDDLKDFDGAVWFRTTFDLPANYEGGELSINLLQIDDYDMAWVNGVKVGETYGKHNHRGYKIPENVLKPTGNVLVVRVFDAGGIGGFTTSAFWGNYILWGDWVYKKGLKINPSTFDKPIVPSMTPFSSPTVMYNGNIAPITNFGIKGVIWYQGESNASRAYEYRDLFPALIKDWRKQWAQGDFPFLFVQLANHRAEVAEPSSSEWAELREAQTMALELPNTGMALAIDIGEAADIHPKNKEEVGRRLALSALEVAYGLDTISQGPCFKSFQKLDNEMVVSFDNVGAGLITLDKFGYIHGFELAGSDQKFYWAKAEIIGDKVVVSSNQVEDPSAIRFLWSDNPGTVDLYNKNGLPALPFRTDQWPGVTFGKQFKSGPRF